MGVVVRRYIVIYDIDMAPGLNCMWYILCKNLFTSAQANFTRALGPGVSTSLNIIYVCAFVWLPE